MPASIEDGLRIVIRGEKRVNEKSRYALRTNYAVRTNYALRTNAH